MGGYSIPSGVVISFTIDENALVASTQAAIQKMSAEIQSANKKNAQAIVSQIASPFQEQAARLRALYSTGQIGLKALQVEQKKLIDLQDQEISSLLRKDSLTKSELVTLKQITLERERQANALKRGIGVGVTSGTQSALGLVTGGISGVQKNIAQLGTRLLGVSGGSGLETGAFDAAASGLNKIALAGGPAVGVLASVATVALAAGGAVAALAVSGGNLAERLSNISQRTGISVKDLQVLEGVAKTTNLDLEDLVTGFRKFSQALTGGGASGQDGFEGAGKTASNVLKILGVTSKDSFTAIEQTADAFQKLPDGPIKSRAAIELFGKSGLNLIPILNQGRDGIEKYRAIVEKYAGTISDKTLKSQNDFEDATLKLSSAFDKLKLNAVPALDILTKLTTAAANFLNAANGGSTQGQTRLEKILFFISPFGANNLGIQLAQKVSGGLDEASKSASIFGASLDGAFKIAEDHLKNTSPLVEKLARNFDGSAEALRKMQEEGRKELAALDEEAAKSGFSKLTEIFNSSQISSASGPAKVLEEQRQKLEQIAAIVLNFPQLAQQAQAAMAQLTKSTVAQLQQQADEALKKLNEDEDKEQSDRLKREQDLAKLIQGVDEDLAVSRAEATGNAVTKILAEEQKRLDETLAKATELGASEQQLQDLRVKLNQDAQAKIQALQQEQLKKTREQISSEAGRLFDALISGSKNFSQVLKQTLLSLALTPVKLIFEAVATAIFTPIVTRVKAELQKIGEGLKSKGGILGEIGKALAPDDKTVLNTTATSNNTSATDRNTSALQGLTGALGGGGIASGSPTQSGSGLGNFGSIFGGATGAGSVIFNNQPGRGGIGSLFSSPAGFLPGIIALASGGSRGARIGGGVSLAGAVAGNLGRILGGNKTLGRVGGALGGVGEVITGLSEGGLKGIADTTLGGAAIGTAILPGIGTAIGAAVGFIAGGIRALFGGKSKQQKIADALKKQSLNSNIFSGNSFIGQEFDRAAQSSFNQTVASTFSEGPGGVFSSAPIGGGGMSITYAPQIQAFDASGVDAVLAQHGTRIAQAVSGRVNSSNSGLARAVRTAVAPA